MNKEELSLAKEQSCGCGGCTCGRDEVKPELTKKENMVEES